MPADTPVFYGEYWGTVPNPVKLPPAPPEVVEENHERRAVFEATMLKLQAALKRVEAAL